MNKFKCPSKKRKTVPNILDYKHYTAIVLPECVDHSRYDYAAPHAYWDFLHKNASGEWLPVYNQQLAYAVKGRPWRVSAALLANKADAIKLVLRFGGILISDFAEDYAHELEVTRSLSAILSLSREDRRQKYPGLDELVLSAAVNASVGSGAHA